MAFSVKLCGLSGPDTSPLWEVEPYWWNADELMSDPRFKDVSKDASYFDYEAIAAVDDAKVLAAKYASKNTMDHFKGPIRDLDRYLANRDGRLTGVKITIFEWESGL